MNDNNDPPPTPDYRTSSDEGEPGGPVARFWNWWTDSEHYERNGWIGLGVTLALCALAALIFFFLEGPAR